VTLEALLHCDTKSAIALRH